ncbi:hypothetical protein CAP48_11535 [Advenella sp. S44]|uniref:hypothetical protein n=1 Tax=Advenella sp. S44 TaxID=1982755 RepID=UPI000C2B1D8B|nr:hypothetical protein [Advenella sp. S44]PJX24129.1 hypothetical protein CAP48_11535 [Advenella sp. S44]
MLNQSAKFQVAALGSATGCEDYDEIQDVPQPSTLLLLPGLLQVGDVDYDWFSLSDHNTVLLGKSVNVRR